MQNFKASVSLLMVVEKSGRPPGSIIVKYDQYLYPFSDLQFTGNKARPKDAYRLLISASDGTTSTRSNYELEIHCPFNLKHYPFDSHYCPIDIYAGKHPSRQLSLSWYYSDGARLNASIGPISMQTSLVSSENCNFEGIYAVTELNTASEKRIFQAMLWNNEVPSTAYLTAADVWVIAVHILMKMSHKQLLLANRNESVRAESQYRREKQAAKRGRSISPRPLIANGRMFEMKPLDQDFLGSTSTSNYDTLINDYFHRWSDYYSVTAARVDLSARIILPLAYGIVASLYFSFYLLL
uniref:Neurotransmitter-gated ion-channel ligand-binding domain-containing protein n=1 Tax=Onchocerca volvulus TaxID=6282 RepID=A0A8R1XWY8_ONCVO